MLIAFHLPGFNWQAIGNVQKAFKKPYVAMHGRQTEAIIFGIWNTFSVFISFGEAPQIIHFDVAFVFDRMLLTLPSIIVNNNS